MAADRESDRRRSMRICLDAGVEFFLDADIIGARCVDVSQTGISFVCPDPLAIEMRLNIDGEREERRAKIVRAQSSTDGSVLYGLEFIDDDAASSKDFF